MTRAGSAALVALLFGCPSPPQTRSVPEAGVSLDFPCTPKLTDSTASGMEFHRLDCAGRGTTVSLIWWAQPEVKLDTPKVLDMAFRNFSKQFTDAPTRTELSLGDWPGVQFDGEAQRHGPGFVSGRFFYDPEKLTLRGVIAVSDTAQKAQAVGATLKLLRPPN